MSTAADRLQETESPVLAVMDAVEACDAGARGVDFRNLHQLIDAAERDPEHPAPHALFLALRMTVRALEHGRLGHAKATLHGALMRAARHPVQPPSRSRSRGR